MLKNNITPGATVGIILANSTIPMVGNVFTPGNGNYMWPTCECGYKLGKNDIYGSLLKCGNPSCSVRLDRMRKVISSIKSLSELDLNKLLVIDRFRWENTKIDINMLISFVQKDDKNSYYNYLVSFLKTDLQIKNLMLVWEASFIVLRENVGK